MTGAASHDGSDAEVARSASLDSMRCRGCGQPVLDDEPVVYEFIADGTVDAVVVSADDALELPRRAAFVDVFHPSCFENLVRCWGESANSHWTGYCSLSEHRIVAPHPIEACPICGEFVVETAPRGSEEPYG
jgi:hypothetical protein